MTNRSLCRGCDGTGWMPYRSEAVDGGFEEAYRLCPNCHAPRRCMGFEIGHACLRPGTVRDGLRYYCKEHAGNVHVGYGVEKPREAIY